MITAYKFTIWSNFSFVCVQGCIVLTITIQPIKVRVHPSMPIYSILYLIIVILSAV